MQKVKRRQFPYMANLIIVESPSKTGPIKSYLGSNYKVVASAGHVRDLPKSSLGVDIENNFEPHYINIRGKGDIIKSLRKEAKAANKVFLATDPDREGEAISYHLAEALGIDPEKACRITFNEVTKSAIKEAVKKPRPINMDLVNSQQTRRILDRIVGYQISPFLWKSVKSGLSAGRVQSVATKIIVEREREIAEFIPEEYWTVEATLKDKNGVSFLAGYFGKDGKKCPIENGEDAEKVKSATEGKTFYATSVKHQKKLRAPAPPFTTSTMQQEASRKLGFQSQRIMKVAQELYEGVNLGAELGGTHGLITYMRTDSLRVSDEAQNAAMAFIREEYGDVYCPENPHQFKSKNSGNLQDAHEAIRPSDIRITPKKAKKYLTNDQYKLYKLIWERFLASRMSSAVYNTVQAEFECEGYNFRSSGRTIEFSGYLVLYEESTEESYSKNGQKDREVLTDLPKLDEKDKFSGETVVPSRHYTEAPPHYNEASLIKFLEEKGIGRPSTITPTITTIISRGYVKRDGRALIPTPLGELTTKIMEENFSDIMDYEFTAKMEDDLDGIEGGSKEMLDVLSDFYAKFEKWLSEAQESMKKYDIEVPPEETDIICDKCGAKMVIKSGRYGKFAACPNYPECKNTKPLMSDGSVQTEEKKPQIVPDMVCEKCGGEMVQRQGKYGTFYACINYPKCRYTKQKTQDTGVFCPKCGGKIVTKVAKGRSVFYSCENYPTCDFSSWDMPTNEICPTCGKMLFENKSKKLLVCHDKACGYTAPVKTQEAEAEEE